ncbi:MAG: hypothetical protein IKU37_00705 [Candidatus Gastranaerophilales bacterium]|nr:hypothetical protein [Candidatus Gastranaerophilales bacterium]
MIFSFSYFFVSAGEILNCSANIFSIEKFCFSLGFLIDENNIVFLAFSAFVCFFISLYSNVYFVKKKQFIFTKQRFYIFLSVLSSLTYIFLSSINLFQSVIILILQSIAILIFSYFDIFKNPTNYNITRFHRITHFGNFALFIAALILFKYAILSEDYISSNSLCYDELNILISYMYGISSSFEFKFMTIAIILAIFSKLTIFPFSCYYSFFANSSNILYLCMISVANNIIGLFLFLKAQPLIEMLENYILYFEILIAVGILFSLLQVLFEKNIKIIFGYLISIINAVFIILFLNINCNLILVSYFGINLIFLLILMILFMVDKNNFKKRIINKQLGFILEKTHIICLEKIPSKLAMITEVIDEKLIQNLLAPMIKLFNYLNTIFIKKTIKTDGVKNIRNILVMFLLIALFAIFIALFGGFKC